MNINIQFINKLSQQYDDLEYTGEKIYLTASPLAGISFSSYKHWFLIILSRCLGTSFHLQNICLDLRERICTLLSAESESTSSSSENWAKKALKVMLVTEKIVRHVWEKTSYTSQDTKESLEKELFSEKSIIRSLFLRLEKETPGSAISLALEYNSPEWALHLLQQRYCVELHNPKLADLIHFAISTNKISDVLDCIENEIPLPDDQQLGLSFLFESIQLQREKAAKQIIAQFSFTGKESYRELPIIMYAAQNGLQGVISAYFAKNTFHDLRDKEENSILYHVLFSQNLPLIRELFAAIDPRTKNIRNHTPLHAFLYAPHVPCEEKIGVLRELVSKRDCVDPYQKEFTNELRLSTGTYNISGLDPTELAFLMDRLEINTPVIKVIHREEFESSCKRMQTLYPMRAVHAFQLSFFAINPLQYRRGFDHFRPKEAILDTPLTALQTHFQEEKEHLATERPDIYSELKKFTDRILRQEEFLGTPKKGTEALKIFYKEIELHVSHTLFTLQTRNDPATTQSVLKEYAEASHKCGGRYYVVALKQYLRICHGIHESPESELLSSIALFRAFCLESAVCIQAWNDTSIGSHEDRIKGISHNHIRALRALGSKYGIPGYRQALEFDDIFIGLSYNLQEIEKIFLSQMTAENLLIDWFLPLLRDDRDLQNHYIDFHKKHLPLWWKQEFFQNIRNTIANTENELISEKEKQIKITTFLESHEISTDMTLSLTESLENARKYSYLAEYVFHRDSLSLTALIHAMELLGAISPLLQWAEYKNSIQPITIDESWLEKATSSLHKIFSPSFSFFSKIPENISSFFKAT